MSTKAGNRPQNRQMHAERVPVDGARDLMTVHGLNHDDFSYRWVEDSDDKGSRIWKFKRGGWDLVTLDTEDSELAVGQEAVYKSKEQGTLIRLHTGEGRYSYLMRIKKEWFEEDQAAKEESIKETENGIFGSVSSEGDANNGQYGEIRKG